MCRQRQFTTFCLIASIGFVLSGFGCASKSDVSKLREELLKDQTTARSNMEQRLQASSQMDARKQEAGVAQLKDLQRQVEGLRQTISEVRSKMEARFRTLEQVLTKAFLNEEAELKKRLDALGKARQDLEQGSQTSSVTFSLD